ncbi:unnamed protein product [Rhizophagus irregularis]|nr:unnamed protein product [Rhizophagus irregularis]
MANENIYTRYLFVDNPDTRKSIDRDQEVIIFKHEDKNLGDTFTKPYNKYKKASSIKSKNVSQSYDSSTDSGTNEKKDYHIAISQDGRFVATFDAANLRIKILEKTDHNESDEINKMIIHFEIKNDFTICKCFDGSNDQKKDEIINIDEYTNVVSSNNDEVKKTILSNRWSLDISNVCKNDNKYFIFVAVSNINDEDMKSKTEERKIDDEDMRKKETRTTIYRVGLEIKKGNHYGFTSKTDFHHIYGISGICKFIHVSKSNNEVPSSENNKEGFTLRRFIILNFSGIYSFKCKDNFSLYKKFGYPQCIDRELKALDSSEISDCINLISSCIYTKYFLVENYKDNVQLLEVYNLGKMKLDNITIRVENSQDKLTRKYNRNNFSISKNKQLLCFTRGLQSVKLYFMENGLEATSKKFDGIEKIHLLEFIEEDKKLVVVGSSSKGEKLKIIIWDMYNNFRDFETTMEFDFLKKDLEKDNLDNLATLATRLARTSGNIFQIDNDGKVSSVLKEVKKKEEEEKRDIKETLNMAISPENELHKKYGKKSNRQPDISHIVHYEKNVNFEPIVTDKEPWVLRDYERNSYCLYHNKKGTEVETLQLIVGRSTVQIWHQIQDGNKNKDSLPNEGKPFLEYIWTNGIPEDKENKETSLHVEKLKLYVVNGRFLGFYLKVHWNYIEENKENVKEVNEKDIKETTKNDHISEETEKEKSEDMKSEPPETREIRWRVDTDKADAIRHACKALEFINKRKKNLVNYTKEHLCEEMVAYINRIIWRFIKYKPDDFRLLDVQRNVMKNLILGDCDHLIKFILFGNDDDVNKANKLHIPRKTFWKKKEIKIHDTKEHEIENVLELAIYHCREIKGTIIVAYLLEYYSRHATDYAGWMSTVSKTLPLLFKYNYDDYIRKLFRKECFANQNYLSIQKHNIIIPVKYQERNSHHGIKFRAFEINLPSNKIKWYSMIWETYKSITNTIYEKLEDLVNKDVEKPPLALRVVPLPEFTINNRASQQNKPGRGYFILNLFLSLFIPRWYSISWKEKNKLSPFARVIYYENNDDIYDNPATEAIIDFRWKRARTFFFSLFLRFLIYVFCFGLISWAYLDNSIIINVNFLFTLIVIYYYLATYLLITEIIQFMYEWKRYISDIYNFFDIFSIIFPVIVISNMVRDFRFENGFGSVETIDSELKVMISFSAFFLWIEVISYLRLIPNIAIYIYYIIIIIKTVFPFILFNAIMIIAFAHIMFILLYDPNTEIIKTKDSTFSGTATNPVNGQELMNVTMKADFDPTDRNDNPFAYFSTSIISAYYWLSGDFVQRDSFDFWAVEVFTFIASVLLVTILQNMLIAFMSGVYETATTKGRQALLRFRANQIANYEALNQVHYPHIKSDPKYIYYIGRSKHFETWYESRKDDGPIFSDFEKKSTFSKFVFEEKDYDEFSIWKYNIDIDSEREIEKFKIMKKSLDEYIENLTKNFDQKHDEKYDDDIEKLKTMKKDLNDNINNLIIYFEDQKNDKENVDIDEINEFKTIKIRLDHDIEYLIKYFDQKSDKNGDINNKIKEFKTKKNILFDNIEKLIILFKENKNIDEKFKRLNDNINNSIEYFKDQRNDKKIDDVKIEEFKTMKKSLKVNIDGLIKYFEDQKNKNGNIDIENFETMNNSFETINNRFTNLIKCFETIKNSFANLIKYFENQNNRKNDDIDIKKEIEDIDIKKEIENFKTIDIDINKEIEDFKTMNNSLNYDIEKLLYFEDQKIKKNENVIETKESLNNNIDKLIENLDKKNLNNNIEKLINNFEARKNDNDDDNIDIDKKIEILRAIKY